MHLVKVEGRDGFADGIDYASELLGWFTAPVDPVLLRSIASNVENTAGTVFELGLARGLRIAASEEIDRLEAGTGVISGRIYYG